MTAGRNDPCPCGSGRKYKKCHLASDSAAQAAQRPDTVSPVHEQDQRLVNDILAFLELRFPWEIVEEVEQLDAHPSMSPQFAVPWLAYVAEFEGRTGVDWFLEERQWALARGSVEWLTAQRASWLSMWEVLDVEPGRHVVMRDLLTFSERTVHEVKGSHTMKPGFVVLCRIVDFGGVSAICGLHPAPLGPAAGSSVVERIRKALRRRNAVPAERLRNFKTAVRMLNAWSDQLSVLSAGPTLVNTEGDLILLTTDRWRFDPKSRDAIVARIAWVAGIEEQDDGHFVFLREEKPGDVTLIGSVTIAESSVELLTNSIARADALVARIESTAGDHLRGPRIRSHTDPLSTPNRRDADPAAPKPENTPEKNAILRELKERHYRDWLDHPLPALDGQTPRATVHTASGRRRVEKMVQEIEMIENAMPEDERFDVNLLRGELGLL